jgi:hypothetical protein
MGGKVTLQTSTDAKIIVWRSGELFCVKRSGGPERPEECLALDLFEVIAELAGLDLERQHQATEAIQLAETAQRRLSSGGG